MSKLERQLDEVYGEQRVVIKWPSDQHVDVDEVRRYLIDQIDQHHMRVPLDLRAVDGAPAALIDLLLECQLYARSQGKVIAISAALPAMQSALSGRPRRKAAARKTEGSAGDLAKSVLDQQLHHDDPSTYNLSKAEKINRPKKIRKKKKTTWQHYALLGASIVFITSAIGAVEWYLLFNKPPADLKVNESQIFEED